MFLPETLDRSMTRCWRLGALAPADLDFEAAERAAVWLFTALEPSYQAARIANAGLGGLISSWDRIEEEIAAPRAVDRVDNCVSLGRSAGTRFCKYLETGLGRPPGMNGDVMIGEWSGKRMKRDYCENGSKQLGDNVYALTNLDGILGLAKHFAFRYARAALRSEPLDALVERGEL